MLQQFYFNSYTYNLYPLRFILLNFMFGCAKFVWNHFPRSCVVLKCTYFSSKINRNIGWKKKQEFVFIRYGSYSKPAIDEGVQEYCKNQL